MKPVGQSLIDYALIIILIAIVAIGIYSSVIGSQRAACAEGYFWSYKEHACLSGYRP